MLKARQSKCVRITDQIREELYASGAKPGTEAASAHEIAKRFQVSVLTANKAINLLVADGFLYRIKGSGTYIKALKSKVKRIGFVDTEVDINLNDTFNRTYSCYIDSVLEYLRGNNCEVHQIRLKEVQNWSFLKEFSGNLDGFLASINFGDPITMGNLKRTGLPVVVYRHDAITDLPFSQVCYNISTGVAEVFEKLKLSLDDPPLLIYENNLNGTVLCNAFKKYAVKYGFQEKQLEAIPLSFTKRAFSCYKMVRVNKEKFRGKMIFSLADSITYELLNALSEESLEMGQDYQILSVGNSEDYGLKFFDEPSISSVDIPMGRMASEACRLLLKLIDEQSDIQYFLKIPTSFIERKSTHKTKERIVL